MYQCRHNAGAASGQHANGIWRGSGEIDFLLYANLASRKHEFGTAWKPFYEHDDNNILGWQNMQIVLVRCPTDSVFRLAPILPGYRFDSNENDEARLVPEL